MKKSYVFTLAGFILAAASACSNTSSISGLLSSGFSSDPSSPMTADTIKISKVAALRAQRGLKVVYMQSEENIAIIDAPADLIDKINITDKENTLSVTTSEQIRSGIDKITVTVKSPAVHDFSSSSGAMLFIEKPYKSPSDELSLKASSGAMLNGISLQAGIIGVESSSGASIRIETSAQTLACDASSGSTITVEGTSDAAAFEVSSGASIIADRLKAETGETHASSGGSITCCVNSMSQTKSSSGGSIHNIKQDFQ